MSLKITTSYKVDGQETKNFCASEIADMIRIQNERIAALEAVSPKPKKVTAQIAELKAELDAFVTHIDSLE